MISDGYPFAGKDVLLFARCLKMSVWLKVCRALLTLGWSMLVHVPMDKKASQYL